MEKVKTIKPRFCVTCKAIFTPKPLGYNAKYCSKKCKAKPKRTAAQIKKYTKRSYVKIKTNRTMYEKHLANGRKSVNKVRLWLAEYKIKKGCIDCGYKKHSSALQLDHEGKKRFNISDLRSSVARLINEIKAGKCVVRCANCHSVKTWAGKNKLKYSPEMAAHQSAII